MTNWFYTCRCGHTFKHPMMDAEIALFLLEYSPESTGLCPKCMAPVTLLTISATPVSRPAGKTIQERFAEFHAANPHIYSLLEEMADKMIAEGAKKVSVKALFEGLRKRLDLEIDREPDENPFKLNNIFTSRYAGMMIEDHTSWKGVIDLRRLLTP